MKYFHDKPRGINHDLSRHKAKEKELLANIAQAKADNQPAFVKSFENLLRICRENMTAATSGIGVPKPKLRRK